MRNIRTKYLLRMLLFILLTIGSLTLIYNLFAEQLYINENKKIMNQMYQQISDMNLENITDAEESLLDEHSERGFHIMVTSKDEIEYSNYKDEREEIVVKKQIYDSLNLYSEDAKAGVGKKENNIYLRGIAKQDGVEYYVYIRIRLRTIKSTIEFMSKFLYIELIIVLAICVPFSIYMANKTIKPIEEISKMTKRMEKNEYTEKDAYKFEKDEIGELAENIKDMYGQITNNISEMKNYNYILKMQNHDLIKFEERRTEFINTATHELKTPLAIISSQLEMMNMDNSEMMSEYYDSIMEEIQKMSNLIRDMLKSSFDDKVMKNAELEKGNLSELIQNLKGKYSALLETKHIKSEFVIENNIAINMNSEQIEQAFNNYIINALEHTKENALVRISLSEENGRAVISVYNQGENIPEADLDKIWNSFYSEKSKNNNSNVGLGLYIVHDIVKYHGGKCCAKNMTDGVTFYMEFDLV